MKILANPIEIPYKYQHPLYGKYAYKETADPTMIYFKGKYYLFASKCGGFYYSDDLFKWDFYENRNLEIHCYAPDVSEHNGYLYFCASSYLKKCKILRSSDPFKGFELVSIPFTFWDPHLHFEGEKAYLYWGCSAKTPIYGTEMDIKTMKPIGKKKALVYCNKSAHGIDDKDIYKGEKISLWQRYVNLFTGSGSFIEGAFMNKINGKYYLQYATPGTEYPTYGDAVLIGDSPLGEFTWQEHNPFSIVPSGYFTAAGHGSTFLDKFGNLWHTSTLRISLNNSVERRIGLWPAGVDKDGILFTNQYFSDYPKEIPEGKFDPLSITPKWMLLSYKKDITCSSSKDGQEAKNALDEDVRTLWVSNTNKSGEWLKIDLADIYDIGAIQVNFGDYQVAKKKAPRKEYGGTFTQERYIEHKLVEFAYRLEYSLDGNTWFAFGEGDYLTPLSHYLITSSVKARYIKITFKEAPYGQYFSISGLRVFGLGKGEKPSQTSEIIAKRISDTKGIVSWKKVENATGYAIRIGIAPDKLYNSVLLYDTTEYQLTFLNKETKTYYYAVDSFNEQGITKGKIKNF